MQKLPPKSLAFIIVLGVSLLSACNRAPEPAPASDPTNGPANATSTTPDANSLVNQGVESGKKGDLNGAIDAFNQAIKIDPTYAPAYDKRGFALSLQNKLDEAISDYNQALHFDPKNVDALYHRGVAKGQQGDFDGAIADFDQAIELRPQFPPAYYNRGHAKYFTGDLDGATSDLNQAITMTPGYAPAYFIRGLVHRAQGDAKDAETDFQTSASDGFYYGAFWLWIVKMETSQQGDAQKELASYIGKPDFFKNDEWAPSIADLLLGKMTQDQLVAKAQTDARLSEAWFYSGMAKYFAKDINGAKDSFKKSIATQVKGSEVVTEARRELLKLDLPAH